MMSHSSVLRRLAALALAAAMLATLGACGKKAAVSDRDETFRVAVCGMPDELNPVTADSDIAAELFLLLYEPLWRTDADGSVQPALVESYSLSTDQTIWTLYLRRGVLFSDGTEVTSLDVSYTITTMQRYNAPLYADELDGIISVDCPDDYTVVLHTDGVKTDLLYGSMPILPRHLWYYDDSVPTDYDNSALVGAGPFRLAVDEDGEPIDDTALLLTRNEDWYGEKPQLANLRFDSYTSAMQAAEALTDGKVDACFNLSATQRMTLGENASVTLTSAAAAGSCAVLCINTLSGSLQREEVRRALDMCIDRESILTFAFAGAGNTSQSFLSADDRSCSLTLTDTAVFDPEGARQLLLNAGWRDTDDDGILESADGEGKLSFTLWSGDEGDWLSTTAALIRQDCLTAGISLTWTAMPDYDLAALCTRGGSWDLCLAEYPSYLLSERNAARYLDHISGWESPEYETLYSQLTITDDALLRANTLDRMQQLVLDGRFCLSLVHEGLVQAIRSDLWTGYEELLTTRAGLFRTGDIATWLCLTRIPAAG